MKIGFNLIQYTDLQGIEVYARDLIAHLKPRQNDELILFTNQKSAELFKNLNPSARIIVKNFPCLSRGRLILYQQFGLVRRLNKEKIDLLFCPSLALPLFYRKKIVIIHDLAFRRFRRESRGFFRLYLHLALLSAKYLSLKIGTISEFARQEIIKLLKVNPAAAVHGGSCLTENAGPNPEERQKILEKFGLTSDSRERSKIPYFIYIGNAYARKNLPMLLEAFKLFSLDHPDHQLVLAGKKDRRLIKLEKMTDNLKIKDKILFPGFISQQEKIALIKEANALVLVSVYEGLGLPVLEAQGLGTPVLAAHAASLPEVAGAAAVFVNPKDPTDIAAGLRRLADDENLRRKLSRQGYDNVKRYSWDRAAEELGNLLS